jgi:hypothetical protein
VTVAFVGVAVAVVVVVVDVDADVDADVEADVEADAVDSFWRAGALAFVPEPPPQAVNNTAAHALDRVDM